MPGKRKAAVFMGVPALAAVVTKAFSEAIWSTTILTP
jgi:hypothetical protein